jgi:hypothetical protein
MVCLLPVDEQVGKGGKRIGPRSGCISETPAKVVDSSVRYAAMGCQAELALRLFAADTNADGGLLDETLVERDQWAVLILDY